MPWAEDGKPGDPAGASGDRQDQAQNGCRGGGGCWTSKLKARPPLQELVYLMPLLALEDAKDPLMPGLQATPQRCQKDTSCF